MTKDQLALALERQVALAEAGADTPRSSASLLSIREIFAQLVGATSAASLIPRELTGNGQAPPAGESRPQPVEK